MTRPELCNNAKPLLCATPSPDSLPAPIGDIPSRGSEQIYYRNQAALAMAAGAQQNSLRKKPGAVQSRDFAPERIDATPVTYLEGWALKESARGLPMQPGLAKHESPGDPPSLLKLPE